jgi:hypothetical protein
LDVQSPHEYSLELCHWFCCILSNPLENRSLCQINFRCMFIFANNALQHWRVFQIQMMMIIDNKKSLTYINLTMRPLSNNLCLYGFKLENIWIWHIVANLKVDILNVWKWGCNYRCLSVGN